MKFKSFTEWKNECLSGGESVRYLTHSMPIYDRDGVFLNLQKDLLQKYYSVENAKKEYKKSFNIVRERSYYGADNAQKGLLIAAIINLESALFEAISSLIYRNKGITATSLLLSEFEKISKNLGHSEWFNKTVEYMRFDISYAQSSELLRTYNELFGKMRIIFSNHRDIVKKIKRMKLDCFSAGYQLEELCSEINYRQLYDKVMRSITRSKMYEVGLSLFFEAHYNFFMFSPFFYLKNINRTASGKEIVATPFDSLVDYWDDDIKKLWKKVNRIELLTEKSLIEMSNLSNEIVSFCPFI